MTTTHEVGHLVGGYLSGGTLRQAELRPWHLPHSRFSPDPRPLITLWSGPVLGVLVPIALAAIIRRRWGWFVANFCLLANGVYLALAWTTGDQLLDTARLFSAGASRWSVAVFCLGTIGLGYPRFRQSLMEVFKPRTREASDAES
ncbi:hypothetical protein [Aeoliella mucimassa]|nr:hypothetical protein [Aeoliella mucimassa]